MALFDLVGRRWTLRIIWELEQSVAPLTFRELRARCSGMSSSVLTQRLRELDDARLVERAEPGYALSASGRELVESLAPVLTWSERWAQRLEAEPAQRLAVTTKPRASSVASASSKAP